MLGGSDNFYDGCVEHEIKKVTRMKFRFTPILAGLLALTVTAAPQYVAQAQSNQPNQSSPQQGQRPGPNVQLTEQQKARLAEIQRNTRTQIERILTPQQREQMKAAMQNRQNRKDGFAAMNLSSQQKTQLQTIIRSARSQSEAVLTPQQRQQIQQYIQQRRQQRSS